MVFTTGSIHYYFLSKVESLKDSLNFDDWQFFQAESLRRELTGALERLVQCQVDRGEFEPAIGNARRWLELDPLHELAHCQLMKLYAWSGGRSAALRQYQECARILREQVDASPLETTIGLYEAIKEGHAPKPPLLDDGGGYQKIREGRGSPTSEPPTAFKDEGSPVDQTAPTLMEEENRVVTVLFVDIGETVGETNIHEDRVSLIDRFLRVVKDVALKYGGGIDRFLGESASVLFGRTQTHESDPELAIRAVIEIRSEAKKLGLGLTAGINTGGVYFNKTDTEESQELTRRGGVVNLAVRMAGKVEEGGILVGESTYHHTHGAFEFTPLSIKIRGIDDPVTVFRVERLLPEPKKARGIEGLRAELIGRDEDFSRLKEALAQVLKGQGGMVSLIGEAGVGKSRLVFELKEYLVSNSAVPNPQSEIVWHEGRCLEMGIAASYWPFIDILREYFAWSAESDESERAQGITLCLQEMVDRQELSEERRDEIGPLLGNLLSIRFGNEWDERLSDLDPESVKYRTFIDLRDFFLALAKQEPVILVLEDLHWADNLSLDLISLLMETLADAPILLLCVYRPEREHKCWHLATIATRKCPECYTEIHLNELSHDQSRRLVESLMTIDDLPASVKDLILRKSQGNPFFVEEVVRSMIDSGVVYREGDFWRAGEGIESVVVPESIQSVILSRLDHLDEDLKNVLQIASVIGRLFNRRVLQQMAKGTTDLENLLWELMDRALIYEERTIPEEEYSFKHVLMQEAVYGNILSHRREIIHNRVAEAIEVLYGSSLEEYYEQLVYHYDRGGDVEKALEYLFKAGEKAKGSFANEAAIAHLTRGLELLETTSETHERNRQELNFQIALGLSQFFAKGNAAAEVEMAYARARELCEKIGDDSELFQVLIGLRRFYFARGKLKRAHGLGEELLALAQSHQDPNHLSRAHFMLVETLCWFGEFTQALEHCELGISFYDPHQQGSQVLLYGTDIWAASQSLKSLAFWHLGYPNQALEGSREALNVAQELSHPFSLAYTLYMSALINQFCREVNAVEKLVERVIRLATERGFPFWLALGTILRGWSLSEKGEIEEGIEQMRQGLGAFRASGAQFLITFLLSLLAEGHGKAGRAEEGLTILSEALNLVEENGECMWEAELYRLKGELLKASSSGSSSKQKADIENEVEECFIKALDTARSQRAKSLELRAAVSMSRLWSRQGKKEEAKKLLAEVYGWFTEGFDTADLKEAKALLDELL